MPPSITRSTSIQTPSSAATTSTATAAIMHRTQQQQQEDDEDEYINLWETCTSTVPDPAATDPPSDQGPGEKRGNTEDMDEEVEEEVPASPLDALIAERSRIQTTLSNIQSLIRLTKVNIESLNERFASIKHPPSEYLIEYEDLTTRLNDFQMQENALVDELDDVMLKIRELRDKMRKEKETLTYSASMILTRPSSTASGNMMTGTSSSTGTSPLGLIKAWLPNSQRTVVSARAGSTLAQVLRKALKMRKLRTECTLIYRKAASDAKKELVDWSSDSAAFAGQELVVDLIVDPSIMSYFSTSISHNFMRKTFFSLTFCDVCSRILFQGFRCDVCAFKFHQKCAPHVPNLCQPISSGIPGSGSGVGTAGVPGSQAGSATQAQISRMAAANAATAAAAYASDNPAADASDVSVRGRQFRTGSREDELEVNDNFYSHLLAMNAPRTGTSSSAAAASSRKRKKEKKKKRKNMFRSGNRQDSPTQRELAETAAALTDVASGQEDGGTGEGGSRERSTSAPNVHLIHPKNAAATDANKKNSTAGGVFRNRAPAPHQPQPLSSSAAASPTVRVGREVSSAANTSKTGQFFFSSSSKTSNGNSAVDPGIGVSSGKSGDVSTTSNVRPRARSADESTVHRVHPMTEEEANTVRSRIATSQAANAAASASTAGTSSTTTTVCRKQTTSGIEDWEIPESEIDFGKRIGSGSFGTVFKGMWHGPVALKKLNVFKDQKPTQSQLQAFKNEVAVLRYVLLILVMIVYLHSMSLLAGKHDTGTSCCSWDA